MALTGCFDTVRNPRSAVCLDVTGTLLWLVAVDGRSNSAAGMTCNETRELLLDLGCHNAAMLDGGGSTTLVVDGDVVNTPSDGSPRTVSNHLGIVYSETMDPSCAQSNGLWCDGTTIRSCQGGRPTGPRDCAALGATCQQDGAYAFCVDARCPGGDGLGAGCLDETQVAYCTDGQYASSDCAPAGLVCGTDSEGGRCMEARCEAGPHSSFCTNSGLLASCAEGIYGEAACSDGQVCDEAQAACVDPDAGGDSDSPSDDDTRGGSTPGGDTCGCRAPTGGAAVGLAGIALAAAWFRRRGDFSSGALTPPPETSRATPAASRAATAASARSSTTPAARATS